MFITYQNHLVNLILCTRFLLTHLKDPVTVAQQLLKFVNPGGMLIMTEANGGPCNFSKYSKAACAWSDAFMTQHIIQGSSLVTADLLNMNFPDCIIHNITGKFDTPEKKLAMSEGVKLVCKIIGGGTRIQERLNPVKKYGFQNLESWIEKTDKLVADPEFTFEMNPMTIVVGNPMCE